MLFNKRVKRETVFVLSGYCWEKDALGFDTHSYPMIPQVYSCKALAMKAIRSLIKETEVEAAEMDYSVECEWKRDYNTLEIKFSNGMIENWVLYENEIR